MNKIKLLIGSVAFLALGFSCNSLDVDPSTELKDGVTDVASARAAMVGVYDGLQNRYFYGQYMPLFGDLRGGDMQPSRETDTRTTAIYEFNNRNPDTGGYSSEFWLRPYWILNRINNITVPFEEEVVTDGTDAERNNILGEAYALRAMMHFDVVRMFGVPYMKDNGASWGAILADKVFVAGDRPLRSTVAETYTMIVNDLTKAITLLDRTAIDAPAKIAATYGKMNYWAARSLLARVYLYMGNWPSAFSEAKAIIDGSPYTLIPNADYVSSWSLAHSSESIFSVVSTTTDNIGRESMSYVSNPEQGYGEIIITDAMIALLRELDDDVRATMIDKDKNVDEAGDRVYDGWFKKYPGQGDIMTANIPVLRLSEVYLIAAEAALKNNDQTNADLYLNAIRQRASASATALVGVTNEQIVNERRKELVHEGHRFFDICRQNLTVDRTGGRNFLGITDTPIVSWNEPLTVLPIPRIEIDANPEIQPNPGYTHFN